MVAEDGDGGGGETPGGWGGGDEGEGGEGGGGEGGEARAADYGDGDGVGGGVSGGLEGGGGGFLPAYVVGRLSILRGELVESAFGWRVRLDGECVWVVRGDGFVWSACSQSRRSEMVKYLAGVNE